MRWRGYRHRPELAADPHGVDLHVPAKAPRVSPLSARERAQSLRIGVAEGRKGRAGEAWGGYSIGIRLRHSTSNMMPAVRVSDLARAGKHRESERGMQD